MIINKTNNIGVNPLLAKDVYLYIFRYITRKYDFSGGLDSMNQGVCYYSTAMMISWGMKAYLSMKGYSTGFFDDMNALTILKKECPLNIYEKLERLVNYNPSDIDDAIKHNKECVELFETVLIPREFWTIFSDEEGSLTWDHWLEIDISLKQLSIDIGWEAIGTSYALEELLYFKKMTSKVFCEDIK